MNRVVAAGGWVQFNRVNGNLALSRAFGDFVFKRNEKRSPIEQIVIAYPDIQTRPLSTDLEFIVIACDGVWDVMTNDEVVEFVRRRLITRMDPVMICEELITRCLAPDCQMGSGIGCDNMTVILVCYLNGAVFETFCDRIVNTSNSNTIDKSNVAVNGHEESNSMDKCTTHKDAHFAHFCNHNNEGQPTAVHADSNNNNPVDEANNNSTTIRNAHYDGDDASDSSSSECNSAASTYEDPMMLHGTRTSQVDASLGVSSKSSTNQNDNDEHNESSQQLNSANAKVVTFSDMS